MTLTQLFLIAGVTIPVILVTRNRLRLIALYTATSAIPSVSMNNLAAGAVERTP